MAPPSNIPPADCLRQENTYLCGTPNSEVVASIIMLQRSSGEVLVQERLQACDAGCNDANSCQSTDVESSIYEADKKGSQSDLLDSSVTTASYAIDASSSKAKATSAAQTARATHGKRNRRKIKNPPYGGLSAASVSLGPSLCDIGAGASLRSRLRKQGRSLLSEMKLQEQFQAEISASKAALKASLALEPRPEEWPSLGGEPMKVQLLLDELPMKVNLPPPTLLASPVKASQDLSHRSQTKQEMRR